MSSRYCNTEVDAQRMNASGFVAAYDHAGRLCWTAPNATAPRMPALNTRTVYPYRASNELSIQQTALPQQLFRTPACLLYPHANSRDATATYDRVADGRACVERLANHHSLGGRGLIAGGIPGRGGIPRGESLEGGVGVGMTQLRPSPVPCAQSSKTFPTLPIGYGRGERSYERSSLLDMDEVERERAITCGGTRNRPQPYK